MPSLWLACRDQQTRALPEISEQPESFPTPSRFNRPRGGSLERALPGRTSPKKRCPACWKAEKGFQVPLVSHTRPVWGVRQIHGKIRGALRQTGFPPKTNGSGKGACVKEAFQPTRERERESIEAFDRGPYIPFFRSNMSHVGQFVRVMLQGHVRKPV